MPKIEVDGQKFIKANPGHKDWETPPDLFKALSDWFHLTFDAAASHDNHLCHTYSTPEGTYYRDIDLDGEKTDPEKLNDMDGLTVPWHGLNVWCNPPYDRTLEQWVDKALKREAEVAALLLPSHCDPAWYKKIEDEFDGNEEIRYLPQVSIGDGIWFGFGTNMTRWLTYRGRLRFWHDGKRGGSPRGGNKLLIVRR